MCYNEAQTEPFFVAILRKEWCCRLNFETSLISRNNSYNSTSPILCDPEHSHKPLAEGNTLFNKAGMSRGRVLPRQFPRLIYLAGMNAQWQARLHGRFVVGYRFVKVKR